MFTKEDEGQHCTHDRTGEREVQCYPRRPINGPAPCYRLLYTCMYGARYFNQLWTWRVIN